MARRRNRSVFSQDVPGGGGWGLMRMLALTVVLAVLGGVLYLGFADLMPTPTLVEKPIPHDAFAD